MAEKAPRWPEHIKRPLVAPLLPRDFIDEAPTDRGINEFMNWLSDNLRPSIEEETICIEEDNSRRQHARERSRILWKYINYSYRMHRAKDPEVKKRREKLQSDANAPDWLRKGTSVEHLRQRQIGLEIAICVLGLDREKEILDQLFREAAAIPGYSSENREESYLLPENI